MKIGIEGGTNWVAEYYEATVVSAVDYYPFACPETSVGSAMAGRKYNDNSYRFGFNGQEEDPEWKGSAVVFKYRIHDARIGKFLSVDPLASEYPWNSTYAFAENRVIDGIDLEGKEHYFYLLQWNSENSVTYLKILESDATIETLIGTYDLNINKGSYIYGPDENWHKIPEEWQKKTLNYYNEEKERRASVQEIGELVNSWEISQ